MIKIEKADDFSKSKRKEGVGKALVSLEEEYDTVTLTFAGGGVLYVTAHPEDPESSSAFILANWEEGKHE